MPHIYLCFVWHMHQPFYKDLLSGEYKLPWTRMHALKDYYGMVKVLEPFPQVRQTFNLVPSMLVQIDEYAQGQARDPFLRVALKPAEDLSEHEQSFLLQYFFQANPSRLIYRYPRYAELFEAWHAADRSPKRARRLFNAHAFRDLQVLSQLAWFDEEFVENDPDVRALAHKGRDYTRDEQALMGRKQQEIVGRVAGVYREFAARGQIEISTTPYYHPILPLLCDSNIAEVSHPYVALPPRFRHPDDARIQLERAREYMQGRLGHAPAGVWPSEGSVSDEALAIASRAGFRWFATDNGVLARSLGHAAGAEETYRPYLWRHDGAEMRGIFRDHYLSDLIGFVYSRMGAAEAASHFLDRIRENCRPILAAGRDALVPVVLDGENAWEHYDRNGRPFLSELYSRIEREPRMEALTVSEALSRVPAQPLEHIFPGSWINANFDVWIGAEEDNRAWEYLGRARETYEQVKDFVPEDRRRLAFEELLIAEGSDWCWWYGPEHDSDNRPEFDQLYRDHLANVYRALNLAPPDELSRSILKLAVREFHEPPTGPVLPTIDGEATSYFEWLGAGVYRVDSRTGAMHGQRFLLRQLLYGSDGQNLFLRLDFQHDIESTSGIEARVAVEPPGEPARAKTFAVGFAEREITVGEGVEAAFRKILEMRIALGTVGIAPGRNVRFQVSLWQGGLPMDALPQQGWIEFSTAEPSDWPI